MPSITTIGVQAFYKAALDDRVLDSALQQDTAAATMAEEVKLLAKVIEAGVDTRVSSRQKRSVSKKHGNTRMVPLRRTYRHHSTEGRVDYEKRRNLLQKVEPTLQRLVHYRS